MPARRSRRLRTCSPSSAARKAPLSHPSPVREDEPAAGRRPGLDQAGPPAADGRSDLDGRAGGPSRSAPPSPGRSTMPAGFPAHHETASAALAAGMVLMKAVMSRASEAGCCNGIRWPQPGSVWVRARGSIAASRCTVSGGGAPHTASGTSQSKDHREAADPAESRTGLSVYNRRKACTGGTRFDSVRQSHRWATPITCCLGEQRDFVYRPVGDPVHGYGMDGRWISGQVETLDPLLVDHIFTDRHPAGDLQG